MESDALLTLAMDIGEEMLLSGAEIHRVEDAMSRICRAYHCQRIDVFSITSVLMATLVDGEGKAYTETRRINRSGTDLNKLHRLNCLSRTLCASTPEIPLARAEFEKALRESGKPRAVFLGFAYLIVAGSFTLLFGGTLLEAAVSAVIAVILFFVVRLSEHISVNPILAKIAFTFFFSILAILSSRLFPSVSPDQIIIGNIMLVIPGVGLTNSIRDLFSGDLISGLLRLSEALIMAVAIAAGYVLAGFVMGGVA